MVNIKLKIININDGKIEIKVKEIEDIEEDIFTYNFMISNGDCIEEIKKDEVLYISELVIIKKEKQN